LTTLSYSSRMNAQPVAATPSHNARPTTPVTRERGAVREALCVTLRCTVKWNAGAAAATSKSIFTWNVPFARTTSRHSLTVRNRSALLITDTEDKLIARLAITGESSNPKAGYNRPAAIGTPSAL
jgi:hypothetical protein